MVGRRPMDPIGPLPSVNHRLLTATRDGAATTPTTIGQRIKKYNVAHEPDFHHDEERSRRRDQTDGGDTPLVFEYCEDVGKGSSDNSDSEAAAASSTNNTAGRGEARLAVAVQGAE